MAIQDKDDQNANGIDDELEPPVPDVSAGTRQLAERLEQHHGTDPTLSGGDIDARWEDAESGGDETVGGSTAVPGQNDVDDMGKALGVTYADGEELKVGEKEANRDKHRWELDPASSEDYPDRTKEGGS
jgi:hypothetical protein